MCFQAWETIRSYSDEVYFHMQETHLPGVQFVSAPAETNNPCAPEVCLNAWKTNFTPQGLVSRVGKQTNAGCAELVSPGGKQTHATIVEFVSQPGKQTLFRKSLFFRRRNKLHLYAGAGIPAGFRRGLPARVRGLAGTLSGRPCGGSAAWPAELRLLRRKTWPQARSARRPALHGS